MKKVIFIISIVVILMGLVMIPVFADENETVEEPPVETPIVDTDKITSDVKDLIEDDSNKTVETLKAEIAALWDKVKVGVISFISVYGATIIALGVKMCSLKFKEIKEATEKRESIADMKEYYEKKLSELSTMMNDKLEALGAALNTKVDTVEKERQDKIDAKTIELEETIKQIQDMTI